MIAGNIGGPLEDCREIMDFQSLHEIAPDEMMVNDDLDVQLKMCIRDRGNRRRFDYLKNGI